MLEQHFPALTGTVLDNFALLAVGLALLVKGAGLFVQAASTIARRLGVTELVIGLTLVAIGTSLPELVAAVIASHKSEGDLVLGNVVGANIANITLIIGGAAALRAMPITREMLERDGYLALTAAVLLGIFAFDGTVSRLEGGVFGLLFVAYTVFLVKTSQAYEGAYHIRDFARFFFKFQYLTETAQAVARSMRGTTAGEAASESAPDAPFDWRNALLLVASVGLIVLGGNMLVEEAVFFAGHFALPVTLVGVVLALGTTAPEMSVSIAATRQGMGGMVIGNAIGSVLCNTFLILGVASAIAPIAVSGLALSYALPFFLGVTVILLIFKKSGHEIRRVEGVGLCLLYIAFIVGYGIFA